MIAVIVAMEKERIYITSELEDCVCEEYSGIKFFIGSYRGTDVAVAEAGIGKVAAAYTTAVTLMRYSPEAVINTGIAGGLGVLSQGDVAVVSEAWQHDFDLTAFGEAAGKYCGRTDAALTATLLKAVNGARTGVIATGDSFIADAVKARNIAETFGAVLCDMECAAIAQACGAAGVPFAALKVVSDGAEDGAETGYEEFAEKACRINARAALEAVAATRGR